MHMESGSYRALSPPTAIFGKPPIVASQPTKRSLPGSTIFTIGERRNLQPEDFYWFCLLGSLDHLQRGITAAYDFNYSRTNPAGQPL